LARNNHNQIWTRQRAIFKDYNNAVEKKNFPDELQAKVGDIYVFEGEGNHSGLQKVEFGH
jgi:hypothetical protein